MNPSDAHRTHRRLCSCHECDRLEAVSRRFWHGVASAILGSLLIVGLIVWGCSAPRAARPAPVRMEDPATGTVCYVAAEYADTFVCTDPTQEEE